MKEMRRLIIVMLNVGTRKSLLSIIIIKLLSSFISKSRLLGGIKKLVHIARINIFYRGSQNCRDNRKSSNENKFL